MVVWMRLHHVPVWLFVNEVFHLLSLWRRWMMLDVWRALQEWRHMFHAIRMVSFDSLLLRTRWESSHLTIRIVSLDPFVHLWKLADSTGVHWAWTVLEIALVARNQIVLILQNGRQRGNFILVLTHELIRVRVFIGDVEWHLVVLALGGGHLSHLLVDRDWPRATVHSVAARRDVPQTWIWIRNQLLLKLGTFQVSTCLVHGVIVDSGRVLDQPILLYELMIVLSWLHLLEVDVDKFIAEHGLVQEYVRLWGVLVYLVVGVVPHVAGLLAVARLREFVSMSVLLLALFITLALQRRQLLTGIRFDSVSPAHTPLLGWPQLLVRIGTLVAEGAYAAHEQRTLALIQALGICLARGFFL